MVRFLVYLFASIAVIWAADHVACKLRDAWTVPVSRDIRHQTDVARKTVEDCAADTTEGAKHGEMKEELSEFLKTLCNSA